jgi:hypothetical protein
MFPAGLMIGWTDMCEIELGAAETDAAVSSASAATMPITAIRGTARRKLRVEPSLSYPLPKTCGSDDPLLRPAVQPG